MLLFLGSKYHSLIFSCIAGNVLWILFLFIHISNESQRQCPLIFLPPVHPSIPASSTSSIPCEHTSEQSRKTDIHQTLQKPREEIESGRKAFIQQRQILKPAPKYIFIPNPDAKMPVQKHNQNQAAQCIPNGSQLSYHGRP